MQYQKLTSRVLLATLVLFCTVARAAQVSWIDGISAPVTWMIEPDRPADFEKIAFSGPVALYWNVYDAESSLGGRPILDVDSENKVVELRFKSSGRSSRTTAWDPVCGLAGTFGPLEAGSWVFFCSQSGAEFTVPFEVLSSSQVYYVDAAAVGDQTGVSWTDAFVHLQSALTAAPEGSEIRVAQGTYYPNLGGVYETWDPNAAFHLVKGVTVKGGFAGSTGPDPDERDTIAYETILSGDLNGDDVALDSLPDLAEHYSRSDNCFQVVVTSRTDATTILDGVTITGGRASGPESESSLRYGGGIYNVGGSPIIRDCVITGNAADFYGGGVYSNSNPGPIFVDCVIFGNWCQWWGGGVFNSGSGDITIERCLVSSNGARYRGAGICSYNGAPAVSNCIISGNMVTEAYGQGGGVFALQATVEIEYCTMVGNTAAIGPAFSCESAASDRSDIELRNCIIWNDQDAVASDAASTLSVEYCNVEGGWPGTGNIDVDPGFIEAGYWDLAGTPSDPHDDTWYEGDYRFVWESPCVGAGDPRQIVDGQAMDLYGNPRLSGSVVDMGVYEIRNVAPVAEAEPNPSGYSLDNTTGLVTFDGTASYDPEGFPLTYRWYRGVQLVSTEARFSLELPLGEHAFTLIVNDGAGDSEPLEITAAVYQVIETTLSVWPSTIRRKGSLKKIIVTLESPSKSASGVADKQPLLLFPGGIQSKSQNALNWFSGKVVVIATFDEREFLEAVPENGQVEVRAIGQLKSGQYFSGSKTVKVKQ